MIIAIVDFDVAPETRSDALEVLIGDGAEASALPGNLGFRTFTNAGSKSHVGLMHEWADAAAFEGYLQSAGFAAVGAKLRPMMVGAPVSRRFEAVLLQTVR